MLPEPKIEYRAEQPYIALSARIAMPEIPEKLPPFIPQIYQWLKGKNTEPAGPLFFRYFDLKDKLIQVHVGVPVKKAIPVEKEFTAEILPAGRYAVQTFTGNYTGLPQAHAAFEKWAKINQLQLTGPRTESYVLGPETNNDPATWQTEILQLIKENKSENLNSETMKNEVKTIEKTIEIQAPKANVWEVLQQDQYTRQWYEAFSKGSKADTTWQTGTKAVFTDDSGNGIIGRIEENSPEDFLSIKYNGVVTDGKEDYDSEGAKAVNGWQETYRLIETDGKTQLEIRSDMSEKYFDSMSAAWDKALQKVKELAESI